MLLKKSSLHSSQNNFLRTNHIVKLQMAFEPERNLEIGISTLKSTGFLPFRRRKYQNVLNPSNVFFFYNSGVDYLTTMKIFILW